MLGSFTLDEADAASLAANIKRSGKMLLGSSLSSCNIMHASLTEISIIVTYYVLNVEYSITLDRIHIFAPQRIGTLTTLQV
jgi:hypothetical protein